MFLTRPTLPGQAAAMVATVILLFAHLPPEGKVEEEEEEETEEGEVLDT